MNPDTKSKILSVGHWRVVIRPARQYYASDRFALRNLEDVLQRAQVKLRGWYYPHIDRESVVHTSQIKISGSCEFELMGKLECWEFTRSGQFGHLFAMEDDTIIDEKAAEKIRSGVMFDAEKAKGIKKFFNAIRAIYAFTEIYFFAARLAQSKEFEDVNKFEVIIELRGVRDRMLYVGDPFLRDLWGAYIAKTENDVIRFSEVYDKEELIGRYDLLALNNIEETFRLFNWKEPNMTQAKIDQQKLLERRL